MKAFKTLGQVLALSALALGTATGSVEARGHSTLKGQISLKGQPVSDSSITLWQTQAGQSPKQLSTHRSNKSGAFSVNVRATQGVVHYLVAQGGDIGGSSADQLTMLTVLGGDEHQQVAINELTTVGSVWPNAQLLEGTALEGSQSALAIGSSQVENLVDQSTGRFGATLLKSTNLLNSETAARMNVLSDLIALCGQPTQSRACDQLLTLTNSENTLSAMTSIAQQPWKNAGALYQLFQSSYPVNKATQLRTTATAPYLLFQPKSFSLSLVFNGGGALGLGKLMFDGKGSMWSGTNWMPGSQSGVVNNIGGGVTHFGPGGTPLSPAISGYNGQGINGVGWGTGVSEKYAWVGAFNNMVGVFDLKDGKALGPATIDGEVGQLQGVATAANGDVWIADNTANHMIHFPGGDYTQGERITIDGLQAPFGVAVDAQNRVWVSSSYNNKLTVFPGDTPDQAKTIEVNLGARGVAVDSTGHVWIAQQSNSPQGALPPGAKMPPNIPANAPQPKTIMEEFEAGAEYLLTNPNITQTGMVGLISPDMKVLKQDIAKGTAYIPWGVTIDGNDNVWVGNLYGQSLTHICGVNPATCPAGKTTGDVIHNYQSGVIQMTTDVIVDDAGNLWSANNWFDGEVVINPTYRGRTSTFGGGQGFVVTYGVAGPVQNPLMGPVRKPR
ncbi:hypothetical protein FZZ92_06925 [Synechococcus sp. MU1611]|nr:MULTISPECIES: hypothetical protein [unclassified Synechococcus]MCB4377191.1 hypothetical protein [Synechococcus sp. MU1650]MCB4411582.1 hypothetical protein [Synechococcus sp. MU1611]